MKDTHKIYETPELKAVHLISGPMMDSGSTQTLSKGTGEGTGVAESKAFWGSSLFDNGDGDE